MIDLLRLRYFYAVARHGSFTKASQSLRISQPTISKMIKDLEDDHGVRLLDRGKRGVTLTAIGEVALRSCERIFDECSNLERLIEEGNREPQGPLVIGAVDSLTHYILPSVIGESARRYPRVQINVVTETSEHLRRDLLDGSIEFALFHTNAPQDLFITECLATSRFVIAFRPGVLPANTFAKGKPVPEDVYYLSPRAADYHGTRQHRSVIDALNLDPQRIIEVTTQEMQKRLLLAGIGFAVLPHYMVRAEVERGDIELGKIAQTMALDVYIARRRTRTPSWPAQVFIDLLREQAPALLR